MTSVQISRASLHYDHAPMPVFSDLELLLPAAQWTCLLGESGCGKTSLLRLLAGLIEPQHQMSGEISCSDGLPIENRIAYMAQQDLLLPWLTVLDNICLKAKLSQGKIEAHQYHRARELLVQLNLSGIEKSLPDQLSGGMRQRVALARTLMQDTPIVLMDEPFSALDAVNRYKLQALATEVLQDRTVLFITHDPQEALRLADHLYIFNDAQLIPLALPSSVPPRAINAELGAFQQTLLRKMHSHYE
ncbi:MAG: ATP-binding cassette domain-containing protein [Oceanospirillaceae bacterium]|nr:ATP-binding cassette domain-containing protein [Oceanospirillaceae bacterium]